MHLILKESLFALSACSDIGVDIERIKNFENYMKIAKIRLSLAEINKILEVSAENRLQLFYKFWSIKEAYAKVRGLGLKLDFKSFNVSLSRRGSYKIFYTKEIKIYESC